MIQVKNKFNNKIKKTPKHQLANGQQLIPEKDEESLDVLTGNANGNGNSESLLNLEKYIGNVCANFGNENSPVVYGASQEQLPSCEVKVDTITGLGDIPFNLAYDLVHGRIYVTNLAHDTVSVIHLC